MPLIYFGQEPNEIFFFSDMLPNQEKKKLDTMEFLRKQQETKISEGYNLINCKSQEKNKNQGWIKFKGNKLN